MSKYIHLALGWACVALGMIGVVLPVLPTTVFFILAAFFFSKGSPRLRGWLINHAKFGPSIRAWEETGAIPRRAKQMAIAMMSGTFLICALIGLPVWVLLSQVVLMGTGAAYILSRPDA